MRAVAVTCLLLSACAAHQTAWTTLHPSELPDGGEAFLLIGDTALHIANVNHVDDRVEGRVLHAWRLPPAGAVAIADDTATTSPEQIARRAGWTELQLASARLEAPEATIRSARAVVGVEPDEVENDSDHSLLIAVVTSALEIALEPCCARCAPYRKHY